MKKVKREMPNRTDVETAYYTVRDNSQRVNICGMIKVNFVAAGRFLAKGWAKKVDDIVRQIRRTEWEDALPQDTQYNLKHYFSY